MRESETQESRLKFISSKLDSVTEELKGISEETPPKTVRQESQRPDTRHINRARAPAVSKGLENRLSKLEENMKQILDLVNERNQYQNALLEASRAIRNPSSESTVENVKPRSVNVHSKARLSPYPGSIVHRYDLTDNEIPWDISLPHYKPPSYTSQHVLSGPYWADVDLVTISPRPSLPFNSYDEINKVNRVSHTGTYRVVEVNSKK